MKLRLALVVVCLLGAIRAFAQVYPEMGMPPLRNFTPAQYQDKGKIWDIGSAPNSIVYMAADRGLLEFDGKNWNCFQGSDGFTRSLAIANDSLIYSGSDMDFGVWNRIPSGDFVYTSLYPFRNEVQDVNEEFWDVHCLGQNVFFVSARNIYLYKNRQLVKINAPSKFSGSYAVEGKLYFADEQRGLFVFENQDLKNVFPYPKGSTLIIIGLYPRDGEMVVVTKNSGLFSFENGQLTPIENDLSILLKTAIVFSFEQPDAMHVAFGTVMKGLFIADLNGNITHQINKYKGLLSNTILSLHQSRAGKLWIGMDYGVSSLLMNSRITYFYDYRGDYGTGYTALVSGEDFYLGTNQGLYRSSWDALNNKREFTGFQLVQGTGGQVWSLKEIEGSVFVGHDKGLYILRGGSLAKLSDFGGVWTVQPFRDYLLVGTYNGIEVFRKSGNDWIFLKKMELISGSCNQVMIDGDNTLWVSIPNFGIIRAILNKDLYPEQRLIFPVKDFQGHDPYLIADQGTMHVVTDKKQYGFLVKSNKFEEEERTLFPVKAENLLTGIYHSFPLHRDYDFLPVYNGFALKFLPEQEDEPEPKLSLLFRKAYAFSSSGSMMAIKGIILPFKFNNLRFEFIVPNRDDVSYQHKLDDAEEWSAWSNEPSVELMNLEAGDRVLYARAMIDGKILAESEFPFSISVPWYRSWIAFVVGLGLAVCFAYLLFYWQRVLLKKQKKRLLLKEQNSLRQQAQKHQERIMQMEQEQMQAEFDVMKRQLKSKTIELATKSKDNENKNRLIQSLKEKFEDLQNDPAKARVRLNEIRRLLDSYSNQEDRAFEIQMDELHQEFFRKLKEAYPSLSGNDLRLCAYLKVGLTSKEIADMLNIQPSSAYISRSRLRKKLNLKPDEDLYDFLNSI